MVHIEGYIMVQTSLPYISQIIVYVYTNYPTLKYICLPQD